MLLPLHLTIDDIEKIQKEAQENMNKAYAEYFPGVVAPRLSFGDIEVVLRAYQKFLTEE